MAILNRVGEKFEYENMQKQMKKKKEEIDEEERSKLFFLYKQSIFFSANGTNRLE